MHENKTCPRCHSVFECKMGDIVNCQCYPVTLNDAERDYIAQQYSDCLCAACLRELTTETQGQENAKDLV